MLNKWNLNNEQRQNLIKKSRHHLISNFLQQKINTYFVHKYIQIDQYW